MRPAGEPWALGFMVALPLVTVPMTRPMLRTVAGFTERRELNLVLKGTARLSLVFGLLFAAGLAIGGGATA
jgi:1,4-dihydroxy-2-naphthoate octaprenyltransferase